MTLKKLLLITISALFLINGSILVTLFSAGVFDSPEVESDDGSAKDPNLAPVDEFKSKIHYVQSLGEAISICERRLAQTDQRPKSMSVNDIESRYDSANELYIIFLDYKTVAKFDEPTEGFDINCEVDAESKSISSWKVFPKDGTE